MKGLLRRAQSALTQLKNSPRRRTVYVLCYTALFLLCAVLAFSHFLFRGKGFVWCGGSGNIDGISQHYIALSYWGTYLRDIVRTLLTEGRLSIPMFDASIGLGGDVLQTLSYYVMGDPLNLLSALVPRAYTEYLYHFLILLRLYLAGLSFSAFALQLKKSNRFYTLIGSMVYLFTGYMLYAAVRHPYFSNPMIYLPLILLGAEKIFRGKKPWLFILTVTLAGLSNFYFFYMICIFTVIYVLARCFDYCPKGERKKIFSYLWRFALYALLAVMMACVLFYPSIRTTLNSSRQGTGGSLPLLYDIDHYLRYIYAMPAAIGQGDWDFHGMLPLTLVALFLLFATPRKEHKTEKRLFLLDTLFLLLPFFGWLINGTAYVSNRWVWAYNLLVACICAFRLPALGAMSKKKWLWLLAGTALYAYGAICLKLSGSYYQIGILGVVITVLVCGAVCFVCADRAKREKLLRVALLALTVVQVADIATARFDRGTYADDFVPLGESYHNVLQAQAAPLTALEDGSFYRYEDAFEGDTSRQRNAALVNRGHSTNIYFSLASDTWYDLVRSLGHKDLMVQLQMGLDNRTILGTLTNVKYFTVRQKQSKYLLPHGYGPDPLFTKTIKNSRLYRGKASGTLLPTNTFAYYENEHALPFGYTYDSYITRAEYDTLSFVDRQRALLSGAVLDTDVALTHDTLPAATAALPFTVTCDDTIQQQGDVFYTEEGGEITLTFQNAQANCETYLSIGQLEYEPLSPVALAKQLGYWERLTTRQKWELREETLHYSYPDTIEPRIKMNGLTKCFTYYTPEATYYSGVHSYSINMGRRTTAPGTIVIQLNKPGAYSLQDITVTQLGFEDYAEQVDALAEEHLENVVFADNLVSGSITVSENKLLCLSLPYSAGWRAYVDGEEQEILKTDLAFMGLMLSPGEHTVELRYFTPYLLPGMAMSIIGWSIFLLWYIIDRCKRKQKEGSK